MVTDSGTDHQIAAGDQKDLNVHVVLSVVIGDKTFQDGADAQRSEFYQQLGETSEMPTMSQPSAGDFAKLYKRPAAGHTRERRST